MSPDDLAAAFDDLARVDPEIRVDGARAEDGTVVVSPAAGAWHPESWRRFHSHAIDAARLFDPNGRGDAVDRWLSLVWQNAPELIAGDPLGGSIRDGARASAIVVRRLRDAVRAVESVELVPTTTESREHAAARNMPEQQVRGAADRVRDILSLLTWAHTLSGAGWRHVNRPAGQDVEWLCPEGRATYSWLIREIGTRTGLSQADLEIASATRRGAAADALGQLHRDDPSYLGWLFDQVQTQFPGIAAYLPLARRKPVWLTVTDAAQLLVKDLGISLGAAKTRVSRVADEGKFTTNGKKGHGRRIDRDSFSTWLLKQRVEDREGAEAWASGMVPDRP